MAKTKVTLRYPTVGLKAGETVEVDADTADALVANGSAVRANVIAARSAGCR